MGKIHANSSGISLVINTKNEEKNIVDCINSAKSIADEIIVVDMHSTDRTIQLAKKMGAKVYTVQDYNHVGPARNFALSKASMGWMLVLDADERMTEELNAQIRKIIADRKHDAVKFPRKNIRFGSWMQHAGWWPDYQGRLFKKGYIKWPSGINQADIPQIIKGRVLTLEAKEENAIVHHNETNIRRYLVMLATRYTLEGSGDFFNKKDLSPVDLVNYCEGEFKWRYIDQKGYLDGMRGFISSKFREYTKFMNMRYFNLDVRGNFNKNYV